MEEALKREILEETGLYIYDIKLISLKESIYSDTFHEKKHFIFIDYVCKTDSSDVVLNDEAETYKWIDINEIEHYDLGGFTKELLLKLKYKDESKDCVKIFYNY
ncbi:Nucleoside triphosphatase NudI [Clostridium thermopalmarium DSM 5974]|uniref:Nucleoside triphosphatase NudI n=2 Tax=Clostridium TaxID=1485 RepID=A0A2T0AQP7_9CLOT|nr:Nucleoside triphosphatase NudI [Clostridium thermopalmarium DSM 5974]